MTDPATPATPDSALTGKWARANEARVDSFFDRARHGIHCSLFCGGVKCKHEDWSLYTQRKNVHPAIEGLNSNWVSDNVIASQRPSTSLFLKHMLIPQFKAKKITGVFNLQEKGEHASCGPDGIYEKSGYSYHGEQDLMAHGVHYYEFPWPDMTAPDTDIVLRSVQVMDSHVRNSGRVLVHCHAGLGRTGLLIACYLVYTSRMTSDKAIDLVRLCRPGAVQTSSQVDFVKGFEQHLWDLQLAFRIELSDPRVDLELFMRRQRQLLHGDEGDRYRYIPKPLHYLLCRAISLAQEDPSIAKAALEAAAVTAGPSKVVMQEACSKINRGELDVNAIADARLLTFLAIDWFRCMSAPVLSEAIVNELIGYMKKEEGTREDMQSIICRLFNRTIRHTLGMLVSAVYMVAASARAAETLRRFTFRCIAEALSHTHSGNPSRVSYLTKLEAEWLSDFFYEWGHSVGSLYFDDSIVPPHNRTIGAIAAWSQRTLDQTSKQNTLDRPRATSVEANDMQVVEDDNAAA